MAASAAVRFQQIPGAQVVTMGEMMGTFTTLVDSVRTLMVGIAGLALVISGLTVFNTMLAMVLERTRELGVMRAAGAGRGHLLLLLVTESLLITGLGSTVGLVVAILFSSTAEHFARLAVPLAPDGRLMALSPAIALQCAGAGLLVGAAAGIYPACRAAALQPIAAMRESAQ
jgi:putative ABC transport system permease protein